MSTIIHLESRVNSIYDYLYANSPVKVPTAIAKEVGKIYRALAYAEKNKINKPPLSSRGHRLNGQAIDVKNVASFVRKNFGAANKQSRFYEDGNEINLTDLNIAHVYEKIFDIDILTSERDVFGDSMEIFRSHWTKSNGGQFFTDQRVTQLSIKLLDFNPLKGDNFADICAGTGGFLMAALKHIKKLADGDEEKARKLAKESIAGQELDKELSEIANSTMSFQLGAQDVDFVANGDSLKIDPSSRLNESSYSCLATNPPFGTKITIKDPELLSQFDLAKKYTRTGLFGDESAVVQRAPDILFIERNIRLLKPDAGRLAIVVPYQIVSGPQTLFVRQWILRHAQILAVVDLPPETFQPHTGTKASLLVLKRRKKPLEQIDLDSDPEIFMSTPKWIGHDRRGNPTYVRERDGSVTDQILSDFHVVEADYSNFKKKKKFSSEISFKVTPKQISEDPLLRFDARYYKSHKAVKPTSKTHNKQWEYVELNNVVKNIFFPGRFARNYVEPSQEAVPFLGGTNVTQLLLRADKWMSLENKKIEELKVKKGWILITRSGSVGIVSTVPQAWDGYAFSEHVIRVIPDQEKMASEYLFAFLKTRYAQETIARGVYGSVIDEITPEYIGNLKIPVPKDKKVYEKVVKRIRDGESARQKAIDDLTSGINELEEVLAI